MLLDAKWHTIDSIFVNGEYYPPDVNGKYSLHQGNIMVLLQKYRTLANIVVEVIIGSKKYTIIVTDEYVNIGSEMNNLLLNNNFSDN